MCRTAEHCQPELTFKAFGLMGFDDTKTVFVADCYIFGRSTSNAAGGSNAGRTDRQRRSHSRPTRDWEMVIRDRERATRGQEVVIRGREILARETRINREDARGHELANSRIVDSELVSRKPLTIV